MAVSIIQRKDGREIGTGTGAGEGGEEAEFEVEVEGGEESEVGSILRSFFWWGRS